MELSDVGIQDAGAWEARGYRLPRFDRAAVRKATRDAPFWVHFGAGNIFRAFLAAVAQDLLDRGILDRGIVAVSGRDPAVVEELYRPHDDLGILVTLKSGGGMEKKIVASVTESLAADARRKADWARLQELFRSPSLQMATFTITEKGYLLQNAAGDFLPDVAEDIAAGPASPVSYIGRVAALLHGRYEAGALPLAMVSMDNCSHNGDKLLAAMDGLAGGWEKRGLCRAGFRAYVGDASRVSFPWTMIDKITPRPDAKVGLLLAADGVEGLSPLVTSGKAYVAPFVNAEECQYLVVEDSFPNGRPALEQGGLYFTDRATVDKVEKMKVCSCLNPLHTFLALSGCLLGCTLIADEMKDQDLLRLAKRLGYEEGLPVVADPGIIRPREFLDEVVNVRIPNPFMPDTPQRIACDTSQKLPIRFGETVKGYLSRPDLDVSKLTVVPLVFALWLRYLMGVDDEGKAFEPSPDPLLEELRNYVADVRLGGDAASAAAACTVLEPLLRRADIFGVDLFEAGLADKVRGFFSRLIAGPGAVRRVLAAL